MTKSRVMGYKPVLLSPLSGVECDNVRSAPVAHTIQAGCYKRLNASQSTRTTTTSPCFDALRSAPAGGPRGHLRPIGAPARLWDTRPRPARHGGRAGARCASQPRPAPSRARTCSAQLRYNSRISAPRAPLRTGDTPPCSTARAAPSARRSGRARIFMLANPRAPRAPFTVRPLAPPSQARACLTHEANCKTCIGECSLVSGC